MRWRRRRRAGWAFQAPRCWCGWWTSAVGQHDPKYLGHGPRCPVRIFGSLRTEEEIADQWAVLSAWARACAPLGDLVPWQGEWLALSWSLCQRALMLGVDLPVEDDPAALVP